MTKKTVGRPTVMTEEAIGKLEIAFSNGATDLEACFVAGISKDALYDYQVKHPEFTERKEGLKDQLKYIAKTNIAESIKNADMNDTKWYLERKGSDEFSVRNEVTGKDGEDIEITITKQVISAAQGEKD